MSIRPFQYVVGYTDALLDVCEWFARHEGRMDRRLGTPKATRVILRKMRERGHEFLDSRGNIEFEVSPEELGEKKKR